MHMVSKLILTCVITSSSLFASKIVSVGGSVTETIVALGHGENLIGVDKSSTYPKEVVSKLPNVGYWLQLPKEGILSLKPEVVITSEKSKPKKFIDVLPSYGIKTYVIDDKPSIVSAITKIKQVGQALKEEEKASKIIKRIEKNVAEVKKAIETKKNKPKVLFLFSRAKGSLMAAGANTKPGAMISLAGGVNAIDTKQYTKLSEESIIKINPDVIILTNHGAKSSNNSKAIKSTNAAKNGQIHKMDMLLMAGFSVRVDKAMQDLSCMIYNKQFNYCK